MFYWYWRVVSNCRHLTNRELDNFPIIESVIQDKSIKNLFKEYENDLDHNQQNKWTYSSRFLLYETLQAYHRQD